MVQPPKTEDELVTHAQQLCGCTLAQVATSHGVDFPEDITRAKGWIGQLLERALGATAASRDEPDFPHLGIELKTIPLTATGKPKESTFVTTVPLDHMHELDWPQSRVARKLARVLWIPIQCEPPVHERHIGWPTLWSPSSRQQRTLETDWTEFANLIRAGHLDAIDSTMGTALQVRPKAANAQARRIAFDENGTPQSTLPRGFYLRPTFTQSLLQQG